MTAPLTLTATLNTTTIPIGSQPHLLYLLIETSGAQAPARWPLHLGFVVDKSDSMLIRIAPPELQRQWAAQGYAHESVIDGVSILQIDLGKIGTQELQKLPRTLDHVKTALRAALEVLHDQDQCALIVFASQAVMLLPLSAASDRPRWLAAIDQLEGLPLGDDTFMGRGLVLGLDELQRGAQPSAVSRLIVLTDGFTLDEADARQAAQRAKAAHIAISTLGLGGSFNEDLLIPIADETGGHAYNSATLSDISGIFQQELNAVQSIACRSLELKLNFSQGVELRAAHRVRPAITHLGALAVYERSVNLDLGDYEVTAPPAVLLEIIAPPKAAVGKYRLAQLLLAYADPDGSLTRQVVRQDVIVDYAVESSPAPHASRVMNIVERVTTFKLQTRALKDLQRGDIPSATKKLHAAATRLLDMGETELAQTVQAQAQQLAQQGQVSPETAKAARYKTRKLTQQLDQ